MNQSQLTQEVQQRLQQKKQAEFWPELVSMRDLLTRPPDPTRWVWSEVLPVKAGSVLVAKPRVGKSTLAANLCVAISRGLPFLGRDTQKSPVAYISTDASEWEIADTFQQVGARPEDDIFVFAGSAPQKAIAWLTEKISKHGAKFIVIDTLQRMLHIKEINSYSEVQNLMEPVINATREHNCHILLTHHAKKNDSDELDAGIGSTGIKAMVYSYLYLKKLPDSEKRILTSDQRGGKKIPGISVGFGKSGWLEVQGTAEEAEIDLCVPKITEALQAEETDLTERDIRRLVPSRGILVSKAIRKMLRGDHLGRTGEGKRGNPFRYQVNPDLLAEGGEEGRGGIRVPDSCPSSSYIGGDKAEVDGTRNENQQESLAGIKGIQVPEKRDTDGTQMDTDRKSETSGHESKRGKWTQNY